MAFDMTGTRRMETHRFARLIAPSVALAAALAAFAPQVALSGDGASPNSYEIAAGAAKKTLQLGVGRSVIVDLPQDATEIFIGDPKVANAVVRSARRLYVAAVANGQTTIFALGADGRKIAAIEVTVGRDIGELQELLNVALPGNATLSSSCSSPMSRPTVTSIAAILLPSAARAKIVVWPLATAAT